VTSHQRREVNTKDFPPTFARGVEEKPGSATHVEQPTPAWGFSIEHCNDPAKQTPVVFFGGQIVEVPLIPSEIAGILVQ
jgi:hypothetical protein